MDEQTLKKLEQEAKSYADSKLSELSKSHYFSINSERLVFYNMIEESLFKDRDESDDILGYDVMLSIHKEAIDGWCSQLKERYQKYDEQYHRSSLQRGLINFEILVQEVQSIIPDKYRTSLVKEHYFSSPFSSNELNFNPYHNGGALLPSYYAYIDKETGGELNCSKGETYIIEQLYGIGKYKDYDNLAPLFIFVILSDYGKYIENEYIDRLNIKNLTSQSKDLLVRNGYEKPDHRYKNFTLPRYEDEAQDYFEGVDFDTIKSEKELASFIVTMLDLLLQPFNMEYFLYPENEAKRAIQCYRDAQNRYGEWLQQVIQSHP